MILRIILALLGLTATVAQILLLRELLVIYYGNELSLGVILANWLIWIAFGSTVLGRIAVKTRRPELLLAILQVLAAFALPCTIISARMVRTLAAAVPGEILSPGTMFLSSLLILSVFCSISGVMFAVASRLYCSAARATTAQGTSSVYLLEALGSGIGGLVISLVLIQAMSSLEIALVLSLANLTSATVLARRKSVRYPLFWICLGIVGFLVFWQLVPRLESKSLKMLWGDLEVLETRNSQYGNLTVIESAESRTLYVNGLVAFTSPDPEAAEESVHFALLQHSSPQRLLLIGGGLDGSLEQALQHKSLQQIDYVELDPAVFDLARHFFAGDYHFVDSESRVKFHKTDGRLFLRTAPTSYDVIIVNLPDPRTAQLNRFYTREFFQEVHRKLSPGGLLSFQVSGAENYISNELAAFLGCLHRTLKEVFTAVLVFPGGRTHFFAATRPGILSSDPDALVERLQSRKIQTQYIREYYLPFRLAPDRLQDLELQLAAQKDKRVNTDFAPVAYYYDMLFWSTRFHRGYIWFMTGISRLSFGMVFSVILAGSLLMALYSLLRRNSTRLTACYCVCAMGFTTLALEVLLLLGFQAVYGYVYQRLSLIVAAFMVGVALGSWWSLRGQSLYGSAQNSKRQLILLFWLQLLAAASPLLVCGLLSAVAGMDTNPLVFQVSAIVFPLLALISGLLGGYQFPLASHLYFSAKRNQQASTGLIYGLDILGASSASLLLSIVFFPVYGLFLSALLIAAVNIGPALLAGVAALRSKG